VTNTGFSRQIPNQQSAGSEVFTIQQHVVERVAAWPLPSDKMNSQDRILGWPDVRHTDTKIDLI